MRRLLLTLTLGIVAAFGVGIDGGTAFAAANCPTATPYAPYLRPPNLGGGIHTDTKYVCTGVDIIDYNDTVICGGCSYEWQSGNKTHVMCEGCTIWVYWDPSCPAGYGAQPFWWGHYGRFRIHNRATQTWGSWTATAASSGTYGYCF